MSICCEIIMTAQYKLKEKYFAVWSFRTLSLYFFFDFPVHFINTAKDIPAYFV